MFGLSKGGYLDKGHSKGLVGPASPAMAQCPSIWCPCLSFITCLAYIVSIPFASCHVVTLLVCSTYRSRSKISTYCLPRSPSWMTGRRLFHISSLTPHVGLPRYTLASLSVYNRLAMGIGIPCAFCEPLFMRVLDTDVTEV